MTVKAFQHAPIDRLTRAHLIRETFARSPLFRDAAVSEPILTPESKLAITVGFDGGAPVFGVVASSEDEAYAVLHELAVTMVEIEESHRAGREGHVGSRTGCRMN